MVTAPILDILPVTPRTRLLSIDMRQVSMPFKPGQAVLIGWHGRDERRPYSIACSPEAAEERGALELLISTDAPGDMATQLPHAQPGTLVDLDGPLGTFIFPDPPPQQRLLFVAGGTGISPLRAMMDHALRRYPHLRLSVLYSVRRADEFAFMGELRDHERAGRLEIDATVSRDDATDGWSGSRGRIGRAHFGRVLHDPAATLCFVCGPPAMVTESVATLTLLGVPAPQIRTEGWAR